jgi:YD repeat-containing protein
MTSVGVKGAGIFYYSKTGMTASVNNDDGTTSTASADAATNYAAPQTIVAQNYTQALSYTPFLGVSKTTGANGEQVTMTYDSYGRPKTATSPYGAVWTYAYTPLANGPPYWQSKTGPDGYTLTTVDGLGRVASVQRGTSASNIVSETDTVYAPGATAPLGLTQEVSQPYAIGATKYWTTYTYDGLGRKLTVTRPDGASTTTYAYAGNVTTVTDPAGNWKQSTSDVLGNLTTVVEPDPANQPGGTLTTSYTYDWMGHLAGVSMPRGASPNITTQTRTFVYNNAGKLTSATNPENGTVTYTYNTTGTLQDKHDAKGQDVVYTYDSINRVTEARYYPTGKNNAEDTGQRVIYSYDSGANAIGRLSQVMYYGNGGLSYPIIENTSVR